MESLRHREKILSYRLEERLLAAYYNFIVNYLNYVKHSVIVLIRCSNRFDLMTTDFSANEEFVKEDLPRAVLGHITLSTAADDWSNPRDQPAARRMPAVL